MPSPNTNVKRQFFNSLKRGTGEAYLILQDNPNIDFSDMIIKAAITNYAYDQQCEGSRSKYVYRLIKKARQKDRIIAAVLTSLREQKTDYWGLAQMSDLAVLFFKAGHIEAKEALCVRFEKNNLEGYEFCGQDQLMEIDGIKGVLKVAETIGRKIVEENDWEDSSRVDRFQKKNKKIPVYDKLKRAGKKNRYIDAYYRSILENRWSLSKRRKPTKFTYELIKGKIDANQFRFMSTDRANELSADEVEKLAKDFLTEKSKQRQELYLRFFAKRRFPFDHRPLMKIAAAKNAPKTRSVAFAVNALTYFSGKDIRQLAIEKLTSVKNPWCYLNLLVSNYKKGDGKLLVEIANRSDNYEFIHSIASGFIAIYSRNKTKECKEPLEIIYSKMNCGLCRKDIVQILQDNGVLSDKIRRELKFDSSGELQKCYG